MWFNSNGNTSKFSLILLGFTDFGMTTTFLCMWKRIRTWKESSLQGHKKEAFVKC